MRLRPQYETELERVARESAYARGGIALKLKTPGRAGAPDRLVILPGPRIGFLELKRDVTAEYQPGQKRYIEALRALGCIADVAHTPAQVLAFVERLARATPMQDHAAANVLDVPQLAPVTAFGHKRR